MDSCPICTGEIQAVTTVRDVRLGRRTVAIEDEYFVCEECGEEFVTPTQMDRVQERAADKIRREQGLLLPREIRALRERYGLNQDEFEHLIGAGQKTVTRWERGTVVQNGTADTLLRVLIAHPDVIRTLAEAKGITLRAVPHDPSVAAREWSELLHAGVGYLYSTARPAGCGPRVVFHNRLAEGNIFRPLHYGGRLSEVMEDFSQAPAVETPGIRTAFSVKQTVKA